MYAVFATGGKQHRVSVGDLIDVEKLNAPVGETIEITDIRLIAQDDGAIVVGKPCVESAAILGEVIAHGKDKKIVVFKSKRRKGYKRKLGHRQPYTRLRIQDIQYGVSQEESENGA